MTIENNTNNTIENTENTENTEFNKPKYKNLIKYLHDRNHYKDVDKFNTENKETLLSNFTIAPVSKDSDKDGGKCFCGKKLKNVYYVYCILTNEIISVGGNCKTLFSSKKKNKEIFINRTIELFKNGLGFEPIFSWNSFIGKALESWLKTHTLEDLENIRRQYKNYGKITSHLNLMIKRKKRENREKEEEQKCYYSNINKNIPNNRMENHYEYIWFLSRIEKRRINNDDYLVFNNFKIKNYHIYLHYYLTKNYDDRRILLSKWINDEDKSIYNYIQEVIKEVEKPKDCKCNGCIARNLIEN